MAQQPPPRVTQRSLLRNAGLAAALSAVAAVATGGTSLAVSATFFTTFAMSYGLAVAANRLSAKGWSQEVLDRRELVRSAIAPRRVVFGQVITSGALVYASVQGSSKEHLHLVVALAAHECHSIGDVWLDDERVGDLDVNGDCTSGTFAGLVRVRKYLGTATQTADADLITATGGEWTSAHRGLGVCYLYLRLTWDETKLAAIPTPTALVRGVKVYDPRDAGTRLTETPALLLRHYLGAAYGLACDSTEIEDTICGNSGTASEAWVALDGGVSVNMVPDHTTDTWTVDGDNSAVLQTGQRIVLTGTPVPTGLTSGAQYYVIRRDVNLYQLASSYQNALEGTAVTFTSNGSGTQTWGTIYQHRYAANGTFTLDQTPAEVEDQLRASMAGATVFSGGKWRIYAGSYSAPSLTIGESEIIGTVTCKPRKPRQALVNEIRPVYTEPAQRYGPQDAAPVTDATYVSQDGGDTIARPVELAWITDAFRAQRVAKILLRRSRGAQLVLLCKISALRYVTAETVYVTVSQLGYSARVFRVLAWRLTSEAGGIAVELSLEEDASTVYDWSASEGIPPLEWPDPSVVDRFTVTAPTGLILASGTSHLLALGDGSVISRIHGSWTAAADPNLREYEFQWKQSSASDWVDTVTVPASQVVAYTSAVEDGINYDVRVRAIRASGARSAWLTATAHTVVGKTAAPTAPTTLITTSIAEGIRLEWDRCPDADYRETVVYASSTNNWSTAVEMRRKAGNDWLYTGQAAGAVWYFWIVNVDRSDNVSTRYPNTTAGITGTAGDVTLGPDAVDTINIVANAVTDITSAYTEATTVISAGTWTSVQSISVTTDGSPLALFGACHANVGGGGTRSCSFRMLRDATVLATGTQTGYNNMDGFMTLGVNDAPAAGTYTYSIECNPSAGAGIDVRFLQALETKR